MSKSSRLHFLFAFARIPQGFLRLGMNGDGEYPAIARRATADKGFGGIPRDTTAFKPWRASFFALITACMPVYGAAPIQDSKTSVARSSTIGSNRELSSTRLWECNLAVIGGIATFLANHAELNNIEFAPLCTVTAKGFLLFQSGLALYNNGLESCVEHGLFIGLDLKDNVLAIMEYQESLDDQADEQRMKKAIPVMPFSRLEKVLIYDAFPLIEVFAKGFKAFNGQKDEMHRAREIAMALAMVCRLGSQYLKARKITQHGDIYLAALAGYTMYALQKIYKIPLYEKPKEQSVPTPAPEPVPTPAPEPAKH